MKYVKAPFAEPSEMITENGVAKRVVFYRAGTQVFRELGKPAFLQPVKSTEMQRPRVILTADVERYDAASGTFETALTIYIPFKQELEK